MKALQRTWCFVCSLCEPGASNADIMSYVLSLCPPEGSRADIAFCVFSLCQPEAHKADTMSYVLSLCPPEASNADIAFYALSLCLMHFIYVSNTQINSLAFNTFNVKNMYSATGACISGFAVVRVPQGAPDSLYCRICRRQGTPGYPR